MGLLSRVETLQPAPAEADAAVSGPADHTDGLPTAQAAAGPPASAEASERGHTGNSGAVPMATSADATSRAAATPPTRPAGAPRVLRLLEVARPEAAAARPPPAASASRAGAAAAPVATERAAAAGDARSAQSKPGRPSAGRGPANAATGRSAPAARPASGRSHAAAKAAITAAKPETCPVVGRPVCYYGDCRHWSGAGCAHPSAVSAPPAGDQRNTPRARRKGSAMRTRG